MQLFVRLQLHIKDNINIDDFRKNGQNLKNVQGVANNNKLKIALNLREKNNKFSIECTVCKYLTYCIVYYTVYYLGWSVLYRILHVKQVTLYRTLHVTQVYCTEQYL